MGLIIQLLFLTFAFAQTEEGYDHYSSFSELASHNKAGVDYKIISVPRESKKLIMALHGCNVEQGTTELATAIAGSRHSLYSFCGLSTEGKYKNLLLDSLLHITSTHFDEPKLKEMTALANDCISIHGFGDDKIDFCVGGSNATRRSKLASQLSVQFPEFKTCELCCKPYNGTAARNPVNQCGTQGGVQVEMSPKVRRKILQSRSFKKKLAAAFKEL